MLPLPATLGTWVLGNTASLVAVRVHQAHCASAPFSLSGRRVDPYSSLLTTFAGSMYNTLRMTCHRPIRAATLLLALASLVIICLPGVSLPTAASPVRAPSAELPTFVDLPQGATETYPQSGLYAAPISSAMSTAVDTQTQENWDKYQIAKESNLGLPLGSIYLKAQSGQYVELAIYERAAFTVFHGQPARQILSAVLSSGRIQVTETEFVQLPENIKLAFRKLPIAGEGGLDTPHVEAMDRLLTADRAKAVDANWSMADKMLNADGALGPLDPKLTVQPLPLGQQDATTGHGVPQIVGAGLQKMFGEKLLENAGLPLGPAVWIEANINSAPKPVAVQVFERMIVTYNPANDEANRVQVGLGGEIVWNGLTKAEAPPTATPTAPPATPKPIKNPTATPIPNPESAKYPNPIPGEIKMSAQGKRLEFSDTNNGNTTAVANLDRAVAKQGNSGEEVNLLLPYAVGRNPDQWTQIQARPSVNKWKRSAGYRYENITGITKEMSDAGATELHWGSDKNFTVLYVDPNGVLVFGGYITSALDTSIDQAGLLSINMAGHVELIADIKDPYITGEWGLRDLGTQVNTNNDLTITRADFFDFNGQHYFNNIFTFR